MNKLKKSKTLFISDLDGTLLDNNAKITPTTANIINNLIDGGLIFTYATARSLVSASPITTEINFKYPAVHRNGTFVQEPKTGEYITKCVFEKDIISKIIKKFEDNKLYPMIYAFIDDVERVSWIYGKETPGINFYLADRMADKRLRPIKNFNDFYIGDITSIAFYGDSAEELQSILDTINLGEHFTYHIQQDTYKDNDGKSKYWLEIMRFDATKDYGVKKVRELVGAGKIVCFGDNINDIPMFNVSDEKYAVANAINEVKNIATAVVGSNENDGVAKWLEKHAHDYI